jgi:hypothetical protein
MRTAILTVLLWLLVCHASPAQAGEPSAPRHPNLLLDRQEIEAIRQKVRTQPWASALMEKLRAGVDGLALDRHDAARNAALLYALTGEKAFGDRARASLLNEARYGLPRFEKADLRIEPEFGAWAPWGAYAWAYDLSYDTFSPEERQLVERWLRTACKVVIEGSKRWTTTPNLVFGKHFNVGLVGYCLGDKELIDWALHDSGGAHGPQRGGFYPVLDSMIKDGHFWGETPIYALHYDVHGMLALAEAALHYDGTDLYRYVSKQSGGSIKGLLDGYLRLAYPVERTGLGRGSLRMATYGDGSTGYSPDGRLLDTWLVNPVERSAGVPVLGGELEVAYKRYRDPAYAWVIGLNPARDAYLAYGRAAWGYTALTHGETLPGQLTPPAAPSGVYPSQGFTFLRADPSPDYWHSGSLAALVMHGKAIGHGHKDYFSLILHGKGRLLYPDLNVVQYEPTHLNWTREGIAHNTLLVDYQSPAPGPFSTKHEFGDSVSYFAIAGSPYPGIRQTRAVLLTKEYLADFFHAADTGPAPSPHVFDWVLHGLGRLYPGNAGAYRPSHALVPFYWWVDNERSRRTDATFRADWIQRTAGVLRGRQALGDAWFQQEIGVRMTMLGAPGTEVFAGDGPMCDGPPYHRLDGNPEGALPLVVVRREAPAAAFAAVHEPYEDRPRNTQVRRLGEQRHAAGMIVTGQGFTDYLAVSFDDAEHALADADGQAVVFADYARLRLSGGRMTASGRLKGFRLRPGGTVPGPIKARVGGAEVALKPVGEFIEWGQLPPLGTIPATPAGKEDPNERAASLHVRFSPEEVHLAAGQTKEVLVHCRAVGDGPVEGRIRIASCPGVETEPAELRVDPLGEGTERSLPLKIRAAKGAAAALHSLRFLPDPALRAAPAKLTASVGVVISEDRAVPMNSQWVVRAPGYTMKVHHTSGVSYYLLDGEGHRRHGRMQLTNFTHGIPAVEQDGRWALHFAVPCQFVWTGPNTLTIGCGSIGGDTSARLRYTFHEDRIVLGLVPPTPSTKGHTLWLGNFDALEPPRHNGKQQAPHLPIVADRFFFPHPVHRQGLLLTTPPDTPLKFLGTAVNFPIRVGQEVVLQFTEEGQSGAAVRRKPSNMGDGEAGAGRRSSTRIRTWAPAASLSG